MKPKRITFRTPPTRDRIQTALGLISRMEHHGENPTPDELHKAVAVLEAASWSARRDCLHKSFARDRHMAFKAGEIADRMRKHPIFIGHNCPPEVDIEFG